MRKQLLDDSSRSRGTGIDGRKLAILALSVALVALIVISAVVLSVFGGKPAGDQPPAATATPEPTAPGTPPPSATPAPAATAAPGPAASTGDSLYMYALLNGTTGECTVSLKLLKGAEPVDVSGLGMSLVADGQAYGDVWSLKPMDWNGSDGDALLEPDELIVAQVDTREKGIPRGRPLTVQFVRGGSVLQDVTVLPS